MKKILKDIDRSKKIFKDRGMRKWIEVEVQEIKKGDRIRIYSRTGRPLELGGEETLIARSDAYQLEGVWVIKVK